MVQLEDTVKIKPLGDVNLPDTESITSLFAPEVEATLIAVVFTALGVAITKAFEWFVERKNRSEVARHIRAEVLVIARHCHANLIKLQSMKAKKTGSIEDLLKLRYGKDGFILINPSDAKALHEQVSFDILRLSLFNRNNDIHVDEAVKNFEFGENLSVSVSIKISILEARMVATIEFCEKLASQLLDYANNPSGKTYQPLIWRDELFVVSSS